MNSLHNDVIDLIINEVELPYRWILMFACKRFYLRSCPDRIPIHQYTALFCGRGELAILEWIAMPKWKFNGTEYVNNAIYGGHVAVLEFLKPFVEIDDSFFHRALYSGHVEIFKWAERNAKISNDLHPFDHAIYGSYVKKLGKSYAKIDQTYTLEDSDQNGYSPMDYVIYSCYVKKLGKRCAKIDHTDILEYLKQNGYSPPDHYTFFIAAGCGNLKVLRWLKENNCPRDTSAYFHAAHKRDFEVLTWLKENGCPLDNATTFNNLHLLEWARDNGRDTGTSMFTGPVDIRSVGHLFM